jgi:molecular chaperone DnaK
MIGMDIGTTYTKAAYVDPTGKPNSIPNARGEHSTPSVLYFEDKGAPLVGRDATEQAFLDPSRCVRNFKLGLGSTKNLLTNGQVVTPTDATARLIGHVKENAEVALGREVTEVAATCPANFKDDAKQAYLEAYAINGIKVIALLPEPSAAGFAYALARQGASKTVIVYDFGGGTFDVSLIRIEGLQVTILATEGVPQLGGNDFNRCIEKLVLAEIDNKFGQTPSMRDDPLFFYDISTRIEAAKISLTQRTEVPLVAAYQGSQVVLTLSQDWFHTETRPLVRQSLDATDRAVAAAGLQMGQIDDLVMVGGTSRLPQVQEAVAGHIGLVPKITVDPDRAIAFGAALASIAELAKQGKTATIRGQVIPAPGMFVRDVTAHSVGCCVVDHSGPNKRMINSVIIPKNTPATSGL